jgi:beta-mannosidase
MKTCHDLASPEWSLCGWTPEYWRLTRAMETGAVAEAEVGPIAAPVPGSVQSALREAGLLPDWNAGLNHRHCEWVENRHWVYSVSLPDEWLQPGRQHRLHCLGLDYRGSVWLNGHEVGPFCGTHVPHVFDLTPHLQPSGNRLAIVFDLPPRWLGQFGFTSRVREWKARFNYSWDWIPRLVQVGIWDDVRLEVSDRCAIESCRVTASAADGGCSLRVDGVATGADGDRVRVTLAGSAGPMRSEDLPLADFAEPGIAWDGLPLELWWPNLEGAQPLYRVTVALLDAQGAEQDRVGRRVGFRRIEWRPCEGAPEGADPWLCVVNGRPLFLQGVNYPPMLPNFADVRTEDYRQRLTLYRDLGVNTLRVNGCGIVEKECFYDLCDELGLLVWQDVPLSSSGVDNIPPDDPNSTAEVAEILAAAIARRQHHPSLLLWCGGNELQRIDGEGRAVPANLTQPLLARLNQVVQERDPGRRFLPSTATGPRFYGTQADFGKGLHWNVHGPWKPWDDLTQWASYFAADDALFRAETGSPGASSVAVIQAYAGELDLLPVSTRNPLWRRHSSWWIEAEQFAVEQGREPQGLEEYVAWSQARQARALAIAVGACKGRFPRCGGILLWCGHDCFPCSANTSIIDFHGQPKPAALALREIWRGRPG